MNWVPVSGTQFILSGAIPNSLLVMVFCKDENSFIDIHWAYAEAIVTPFIMLVIYIPRRNVQTVSLIYIFAVQRS